MMDFDIGRRLREVREARGLSQRQLASRSGVTNGMISMLEQNRTSPSVSNLKKILDGIPMALAEFFADPDAQHEKTFYRHDELTAIRTSFVHGPAAAESALTLLQVGQPGRRTLQMLHERYDPGADTGPDPYRHEAEEAGIVIEGHIEITVGEEVAILGPGEAYIFDSRRPHRFRNPGDVPCVLISACTPPTF